MTGNANLHIVSVPNGYAIIKLTGTIYDPKTDTPMGGNTEVTPTDLDFDGKVLKSKDGAPAMYFEKDLGTSRRRRNNARCL